MAVQRREWRLNGGNGGLTVRMVPKRLKWRLLVNGAGFADLRVIRDPLLKKIADLLPQDLLHYVLFWHNIFTECRSR